MSKDYVSQWILDDLRQEASEGRRSHLESAQEERLTRELIEGLQAEKLRRTLSYVANKSPFYRRLFSEHGLDPLSVQSPADLPRIPFTTPEDIVREPFRFACVSMGEIARIVTLASSGTTGEKKRVFFTQGDLRRVAGLLTVNTRMVVDDRRTSVQVMLPGRTALGQAHLLAQGLEMAGSVAVVTGNSPDVRYQIDSISRNGCRALVGYPSHLLRLTRLAGETRDLAALSVEAIVTAGEPLPASVKAALEGSWKAKVFCHYGLTEMGYNAGMSCGHDVGYHIHEADYIVEVVDPATGHPLEDGREGELVITTIHREAMPLVRYKTGDTARVVSEPCACGSIVKRIGPVARRTGATLAIGTWEIAISRLDERLFALPEVVDYRLDLKQHGSSFLLLVLVETTQGRSITTGAIESIVEEEIWGRHLVPNASIRVQAEFVQSFEPAAKRVVNPSLCRTFH